MALASLMPFRGPKKSRFSGPTPSNAPHNDVAPLKIITYHAIKTTGTLIVIMSYFEKKFGTPFVGRCEDSKLLCSLRKVKDSIKDTVLVREIAC